MPEEKKKESFTFSDKIKNSKPIASKSFANRISSKIGSDGKPKKTLFERTKRDAPFFIAALVALLLLPFLYKYSGQVNEEPMVTPGSEESIFDPERYGFDTVTGDPEGQVALFSGRDPLSWIITGSKSTQPEEDSYDSQIYTDRSGMDDSSSYNDTTVEENNTNIYKQNAPAATRAAFRRAATKINPLAPAGLSSRSGGKLGVGMWGGSLKAAAKKVSAEGPRNSPKPVSLQPLQAAGKPSRTYFGQGAAAEARRSKDAMSKANAMQALMDAQMKPIEPGKIGGLAGGSFGPGGGNGDLKRSFAFNGKEPWWWDMMKRRSQMEWEAKFNRKWDWIKWKDKLWQNVLGGLFNCIVMGTDDGAPGKFFGAKAGAGAPDKCMSLTKEDWEKAKPGVPFDKDHCYFEFGYQKGSSDPDPWKPGNANAVTLGPIGQRLDCLSEGLGGVFSKWAKNLFGSDKGAFAETNDCNSFAVNGEYVASFSSTKGGWTVLHYVVGVRTSELQRYYDSPADEQAKLLVVGYIGNGPTFNSNITAVKNRKDFVPLFIESVAVKNKKIDTKKSPTASNTKFSYSGYWRNGAKSGGFTATSYEDAMAKCNAFKWPTNADCRQEINAQAKDVDKVKKIAAVMDGGQMPSYNELLAVFREGGAIRDAVTVGTKENLSKSTKGGKQGKDWVTGARCPYPLARVSCDYYANISNQTGKMTSSGWPFAHLSFANGMTGADAYNKMKSRFFISYTVQGEDNSQPSAMTTLNDSTKGQWYPIPHQNVRPYKGSWSQEMDGAGFVTTNLGTERTDLPGKGDDYQIVATAPVIQTLKDAGKRVIVTWEVRQCNNMLVDGSSITQGGCNKGNIALRDKDGNVTSIAGQDKPGSVVSQVTCVYFDGTEPIGFQVDIEKEPEPAPEPEPIKEEPGKTILELANVMNGKKGIQDRYDTERSNLLTLPDFTVYGRGGAQPLSSALATKNCLDVGNTRRSGKGAAVMFNQSESKNYINSVLSAANASQTFTAANAQFQHNGTVSVPQLVDAMTIAYSRDPNAQVPKNVVCALAKTIAYNSYDPQMLRTKEVWRNTFGAFAAYMGPDSSYYPTRFTYTSNGSKIVDRRFLGCGEATGANGHFVAQKAVRPYHYGRYNWNHLTIGDQQGINPYAGSTGRDSYLNELTKGGWAKDGFNPSTYPLRSLASGIGFQQRQRVTAEELKQTKTTTIDDYNRQIYISHAGSLFNESDTSCGLSGNMPVSEALEYVGAVCINGKNAKPSNGNDTACGTRYRPSDIPGIAGGRVEGESVVEAIE